MLREDQTVSQIAAASGVHGVCVVNGAEMGNKQETSRRRWMSGLGIRLGQRPQVPLRHRLGDGEGIASDNGQVIITQRGQAGEIGLLDGFFGLGSRQQNADFPR